MVNGARRQIINNAGEFEGLFRVAKYCLGNGWGHLSDNRAFGLPGISTMDDRTSDDDTLKDPRFVENPRVVGKPNVRFYIGVPLQSRDGFNIGTLCSMDIKTRELTAEQIDIMRDFGRLVVDELELRMLANTA